MISSIFWTRGLSVQGLGFNLNFWGGAGWGRRNWDLRIRPHDGSWTAFGGFGATNPNPENPCGPETLADFVGGAIQVHPKPETPSKGAKFQICVVFEVRLFPKSQPSPEGLQSYVRRTYRL